MQKGRIKILPRKFSYTVSIALRAFVSSKAQTGKLSQRSLLDEVIQTALGTRRLVHVNDPLRCSLIKQFA